MVASFLRMECVERTRFEGEDLGYSLRNYEFCFDPFKVKEAVQHSEGGVRVAVGYVVV